MLPRRTSTRRRGPVVHLADRCVAPALAVLAGRPVAAGQAAVRAAAGDIGKGRAGDDAAAHARVQARLRAPVPRPASRCVTTSNRHCRRRRQREYFGLAQKTMTKSVPISFEFFRPTPGRRRQLRSSCRARRAEPDFFSVTYGAGGATREKTLKTVQAIAAAGFERHRTCRASARRAKHCRGAGHLPRQAIRRIVALRGDLPSGTAVAANSARRRAGRFIRERRRGLADRSCGLLRYHPGQRYAARDLRTSGQGRPAPTADHAVLLQSRGLLPLRRADSTARRQRAGGAGHHAVTTTAASPSSRARTASTSRAGGAEDGGLLGRPASIRASGSMCASLCER